MENYGKKLSYPKTFTKKTSKKKTKNGVKEYTYYTCKFVDPTIGKTVYLSAKRRCDCEAKAKQYVDRVNSGISNDKDTTFAAQKKQFLEIKKPTWSKTIYIQRKSLLRHFSEFDARDVADITSQDVRSVLAQMAQGIGMTDHKPAAHSYLKACRSTLLQMWDFLLEKNLVQRNVVSLAKLPLSWGKVSNGRKPLSDEQIQWVRETDDPCQTLAMIMTFAGLRPSEACALYGRNVMLNRDSYEDSTSNYIEITHSMDLPEGRLKKDTKTPAGKRRVPMCKILWEYLRALPECPSAAFYCFPDDTVPMTRDRLDDLWQKYRYRLVRKYGLEDFTADTFTPYQCRHTFCTLCFEAGIDAQQTAELMGHANLRITEEVYTHLREEHRRAELPKIEKLGA